MGEIGDAPGGGRVADVPADEPSAAREKGRRKKEEIRGGAFRWILRVGAMACFVFAAYQLLYAPRHNCDITTKTTSSATAVKQTVETVEVCSTSRPSLSDVLPVAAIAILLMAGEFGEVSIPGILSLKRRVEEAEAGQVRVEREVRDMRVQLAQNQSLSIAQNFISPDMLARSAREKVDEGVDAPAAPHASEEGDGRHEGPQGASVLKMHDFLRRFERISPLISLGASGGKLGADARFISTSWRPVYAQLGESDRREVVWWYQRFADEIQFVQSVRNSIAHPPVHMTDADLKNAFDTLEAITAGAPGRALSLASARGFDQ